MVTAFTTALPSSPVPLGASMPLVVVDGRVAVLGLAVALALVVALVVARWRSPRIDARASMQNATRSRPGAPARNLSAA